MNPSSSKDSQSKINVVPLVIVGFGLVVGGFLISLLTPLLFPPQGSAESQQIDQLFAVLLGIGGAVFLLVQGLIFYSAIRFRVKDDDKTDGPNFHGNNTLELVWTLIPAVLVTFLAIYSYQVWVSINTPRDNEYTVQVTGAQFVWNFTYTVPDIINPRTNEPVVFSDGNLYTYVGQPLHLQMQAVDVNHAFWVPAMRIKQDLLVGRTTEMRFTPIMATDTTRPDLGFAVRCAELCGNGHGNMSLLSYVVVFPTEADYRTWVEGKANSIVNPPADPTLLGQSILTGQSDRIYPCRGCHVISEQGFADWIGVSGPSLDGVGDRATRRVPGQTAEEYLVTSIRHPQSYIVPGFNNVLMPQFIEDDTSSINYMPDEDLIGIASYLCTLTATDETNCDPAAIQQAAAEEVTASGTAGG